MEYYFRMISERCSEEMTLEEKPGGKLREQTLWTSGEASPERGPSKGKYHDVTICLLSLETSKVANVARGQRVRERKRKGKYLNLVMSFTFQICKSIHPQ